MHLCELDCNAFMTNVLKKTVPECVQLIRNGKAAETVAGERVTFGTVPDEVIGLKRNN